MRGIMNAHCDYDSRPRQAQCLHEFRLLFGYHRWVGFRASYSAVHLSPYWGWHQARLRASASSSRTPIYSWIKISFITRDLIEPGEVGESDGEMVWG